ncbi:MAG: Uma2 family endonuclease [Candidatus Methylumidiphilus alinenensis]|uniref:Uma2 family endonuclease n=1 Tax=Candidatus Methylumidiphilus alinenensis TaxID=2202197 RepID=A0A2W4QUC8_9GAMM|nr:MAG: Uma2 family endonuclease [Candidatus Methylumidiphilus alinenensis]
MSAVLAFLPQRHRITTDEYYRMGEAGIFKADDRVELIEGEIFDMSPIGIDHAYVVKRLNSIFMQSVGMKAIVSVQDPIHLNARSEPQPDIALLRYRDDFYRHAHPRPEDIILLVEVSDTTLRYDTEVKLPLYARHDIPEVWILDLEHQRLEVFRRPDEGVYLEMFCPNRDETIAPAGLTECRVDLSNLF